MKLPSNGAVVPAAAFSRPFAVDDVPEAGLDIDVTASPEECAAVARDNDLASVASIVGHFHVARRPGGLFQVTGTVTARVTQTCVVSLEPFESDVVQDVDVDFAPRAPSVEPEGAGRRRDASRRRAPPAPPPPVKPVSEEMDEDAPDPIVNGRIDLGALTEEFLTLGLDLYPRKPGVAFEDVVDEPEPGRSAFAALERLKDRS